MRINPFANSNPMTWQDAAKVSAILTATAYFITFLVPYSFETVKAEFFQFLFDSFKCAGGLFLSNFVALAGLAEMTKKANKKKA